MILSRSVMGTIRTQNDVVAAVQDYLDDPLGRRFTPNYILPKIDRASESIQILLARIGVLQEQQIKTFDVHGPTAVPNDLASFLGAGQPLEFLMRPQTLEWKFPGHPDTSYAPSAPVSKLDDMPPNNLGCQQWVWSGGTILTSPSSATVTLRVTFLSLPDTTYDNAGDVMRGIGNLLALEAASLIAAMNNDMGKLGAYLRQLLRRDKRAFTAMMVMQQQSQSMVPRGTKRGGAVQISAGGVPYI